MKFNKILLWLLPLGVVITLITMIAINQRTKSDPTKEFILNNNYPYSGVYSETSTSFSETDLTDKINEISEISSYADDVKATIHADNTITLQGKLKDTQKLFTTVKQLSAFKTWASAFDGQNVSIILAAYQDEHQNLALEPKEISIGSIRMDTKILNAMLGDLKTEQLLGEIPYKSVCFSDGIVLFSGDIPKFLKQSQ